MTTDSLAKRFLDPGDSLGEVLFGVIMTLTFTLGAGLMIEEEGREGARLLLIALIGCNIAWGIIDGSLYLVGQLFDRGRLRRLSIAVRQVPGEPAATALVAGELDELLGGVTTPPEREVLYRRIADNLRSTTLAPNQLTRADVMGGVASFWLVFLASLPAAIPWWARYTLGKPWLIGLCFLVGGLALVAVAVALGG